MKTKGDGRVVEGGANGVVVIRRTGNLANALTVTYKVNGSAEPGVDYVELPGSITIPAGAARTKINIQPVENAVVDGARKLRIKLLPNANGSYVVGSESKVALSVVNNN